MELIADPTEHRVALIAEDDEKVGRMLGEALSFVGFTPHLAFDGVQAMKDILAIRPAVIVLDLILPRMHAQEICSVIRSDVSVQDIPIIVISGWARQEEREAVFRIGADDFLVKPFHPDDLIASVRAVYGKSRASSQPSSSS